MFSDIKCLHDFMVAFSTEKNCIKYLEELRWGDTAISPFTKDPDSPVYKCRNGKYFCQETKKYFTVRTDTIFHSTKIPLTKWFLAIWLVTTHKRGISAHQLGRDLDISAKSAWYILQRIRHNLSFSNDGFLTGIVEMDECWLGGLNKNRHADKRLEGTQGGSIVDKTPVLGMYERGEDGKISRLICRKLTNRTSEYMTPIILNHVSRYAIIMTDECPAYGEVEDNYDYTRLFVRHKEYQYVDGNITTNRIEGCWSHLKRMVKGMYYQFSRHHTPLYLNEFVFRFNNRTLHDKGKFDLLLVNGNSRLRYKDLVKKC